MKVFVQRTLTSPRYIKVLEWGKLVAITGSAQALVQALGLIGGILVIRLLPTKEYALYTLANTMLGTMCVLADGGITAGVMSQGGKVWQDREKLGIVLATGFHLRKRFAIGSLLIATPILVMLLRHHGSSWLMSGLIIAALVPAFITALSGTLFEVAPKLHQDISTLQKTQIVANVGRLTLLAVTIFSFPWAYLAILASSIPQIWANTKLRKFSSTYADWRQHADPTVGKEIMVFVKRIMPGAIYYCLSGQITLWLISIFGSSNAVAQIGALGRLAMVLTLISVLFNTLILPRFARLPKSGHLLLTRYLQIQIGLITIGAIIVLIVWAFPAEVLWILGKDYANLETEVVLNVINGCLGVILGASFSICTSRGWAINPLISIPITIGTIICGIMLFDISSLSGILLMNIFIMVVETIMYSSYNLLKIRHLYN
ncbi:polysaccharide biosynthesis protein [Hymenobacter sp. HD11105]